MDPTVVQDVAVVMGMATECGHDVWIPVQHLQHLRHRQRGGETV